jgi:hypothetical protein
LKSDEDYCSPDDPQHGMTCWSEAVMCRAPGACHGRANPVLTPPADVRPVDANTVSFASPSAIESSSPNGWTEHQNSDCFTGQNAWDLVGKPATCKEVCAQNSDCTAVVVWSGKCFFRNQADCASNLKYGSGTTVYLRPHSEMIQKASVRLGNIIAGERSTPGALAFARIACVVVVLGGGAAIKLRIMRGRVRDGPDDSDERPLL